ncbi:PQQ-binding-like beta-propeller repeat protein [Roseiconus nitratireducens]|uniref:PQQ-binding-like beta-propeller repeat protein n=1 Tax=Roseiconus nitratireducens TaxID=2605748 RepID=A0A5M6D3Z3_9BACT|nr:PQQ-binding-like beta-propeller repeat protein [Roseiconus nitratireducens]KAA5541002.1 PQQ-binding-like beta-propeller repeat protein [Roseiconus nitratireducens]
MLANELIDRLERRGLLDQEIIEALREQLQQGGARVTPEAVAKLLVDNGQLTRFQATKLIGELRSSEYADESTIAAAEIVEDDLGLLDDSSAEPLEVEAVPVDAESDPFGGPFDSAPMAEPVGTADNGSQAAGMALGEDAGLGSDRPRARRTKPEPTKSQWDSFKVYGFLGIIGFLVLSGAGLYFLLSRGNADDRIKMANELYDQQNYTGAQERYLEFLDAFGDSNEHSSLARTRVTMTELYRAEGMSDPTYALQLAKEKLPEIENEEGLNEERGNLAALLVDIAENIANEASEKSETAAKRELLEKLEEQIQLTENPMYMTGAMRTTLSGRMKEIEEARGRVQRDINRNERLDAAVDQMTKLLDAKSTKQAYDVRFELLRDFPELADNERLAKLIKRASEIQQELVESSAELPEQIPAGKESELKLIVLNAREGERVPDLRDEVIFIRSKGSVLALNGEDGTLLWRRYVGYTQDHSPVRLDDGTAVLLSESSALSVERCDGRSGDVDWRVKIGEPFNQPVVEDDEIYVATESGRLVSLDATTGDARWAKQIPQSLEVGPGVDRRNSIAYIPGDHSNLYVLNSRDGSSIESFYTGHAAGTIVVPPIPMLEHLFVVENKGPDYCLVHILGVDPDGRNVRKAQDPIRMSGNVVVSPIVAQQRRLIVLTDLGEIAVFDVEVTSETEKVSVVAKQLASYSAPTLTQMAVGRSQMWTTGSRIGRYELQVNRGRVVPDWFQHEGDTFIGQPLAIGEALVHARQLRGTSGLRVSAVDPKTGEELWRNDIGAPVVMVKQTDAGVHALTSQAALYELDAQALQTGATRAPLENRGGSGVIMRFENPLAIDEQRSVLINKASGEGGQQVAIYDPTRNTEKLRLVSLNLLSGKPSGPGLVAGGGLFLPLNTGRAVVMNYLTGSQLGSPFQPVSDPVGEVWWSNVVRVPDDPGQVVLTDSRKWLYRLRVGDQMKELAEAELPQPTLGTIAGVGNVLMAAVSGPAADSIVGHDLIDLKQKFQTQMDGRVIWGPAAAGQQGLVLTDDHVLRGIAPGDGKLTYSIPVPKGLPVGDPLIHDGSLILASDSGWVIVVDASTGELKGKTELGQPLSATPMVLKDRLLVPGAEGVVYVIPIPSEVEGE